MKSYLNASREDILEQALKLENTTLRKYYGADSHHALEELRINPRNKGKLGNLIEVLHFGLALNSRPGPDFISAGIELKTTGLEKLKKGELVAKERLPLGMIDYMSFEDEAMWDFEAAGVLQKCEVILLMIYLYESNVEIVDLLFKLIGLWEFPDIDLQIIRKDWEFIVEQIRQGKAHELSEGDTLYLGASTAGGGHGYTRPQPFNPTEKAKPRKFSLKKAYLDHIVANLSKKRGKKFGRIIKKPSLVKKESSLEEIVVGKFKKFYGMSVEDIMQSLGVQLNTGTKHFASQLTKAVMNLELRQDIEEFDKAGIITKTVRLEPNDLSEQSISFPAFKYEELVKEDDWEESEFRNFLISKFMFAFFQYDRPKRKNGKEVKGRKLILKKVKFWNMPESDVDEAKEVWEKTVELVNGGRIYKCSKKRKDGKIIRYTYFPNKDENLIAHVRPHGSDSSDTYPLPVTDIKSGKDEYTKHSFWLNNTYIRDYVYRTK